MAETQKFSAAAIAGMLNGTIEGNADAEVWTLSKIEEGKPGSLSFLANPLYTHYIYETNASIVIVNKDFVPEHPVSCTLIRVENAYTAFAALLEMYDQIVRNKTGISQKAIIAASATIGTEVYIGDGAVVGENVTLGRGVKIYPGAIIGDRVRIGDHTTLYSSVTIYSDNIIGANCTLHAGVVIGADGFGFAQQQSQDYKKVAQIGNVIIEDHVEIGANTCIDRATLGSTIIRKGVKMDNLIQIAHNVEIGENTVIVSQTGIAGSTKIGRNCMIGGQVGIVGHLVIGDNVKIAAQSGVGANLKDGEIVQGSPAFGVGEYRRAYVHFRNLNALAAKVRELENKLEALKPENSGQ